MTLIDSFFGDALGISHLFNAVPKSCGSVLVAVACAVWEEMPVGS